MRGMIVRLTDALTEVPQRRRNIIRLTGAYPAPVQELLGEMAAPVCWMQSNKFNGALVLQVSGDGPVWQKVAVAEVQSDSQPARATATINGNRCAMPG